MAPFEKEAPFPTFFLQKMAPRKKEEPKQCHKGVRSADKKMVPLRSRFGSSFFLSVCHTKIPIQKYFVIEKENAWTLMHLLWSN